MQLQHQFQMHQHQDQDPTAPLVDHEDAELLWPHTLFQLVLEYQSRAALMHRLKLHA